MRLLFVRAAIAAAASLQLVAAMAQPSTAGAPLTPEAIFARASANVRVLQATDAHGQVLASGTAVATSLGTAVTSCRLLIKASAVIR